MDPKIKEDWVEALRSGEFIQGRGFLDKNGKQCCLGVLCDIMDVPWSMATLLNTRLYEGFAGVPSDEVLGQAGLSFNEANDLAKMNDTGATFDEIADYIEACL